MSSRLVDAGGDFLVDASGNYLVWELGVGGRMSLALSAPSIVLYADGALDDAEAFEIADENGDAITDENGDALRVVPLYAAPSMALAISSPSITLTTSED